MYFNTIAKKTTDGLYPTVTIRQIMWGLKMKPLNREPWETTFDKKGFRNIFTILLYNLLFLLL